jgi:glycosyltransferase involved in cell wall biosynthesis
MAAYNGGAHIAEAVASVLGQTHEDLELIVVDDASTDDTAAVVESFADERVVLIRHQRNEGPCKARRVGFDRARGSFLCWIDQDDIWLETKTAEQLALMADRPDVGLAYTYFEAFDSATGRPVPWPDGRRDFEGDILAPLFVEGCFIGSITTMVRRAALETRGLRIRDRDFSFGDDHYLWLGLALDWPAARIPRVLARYRRHAANESARLALQNVDLWRVGLLREFLAEYPDAATRLGRARRLGLGRHYLLAARFERRQGSRRRARQLAARSFVNDPLAAVRLRLRAIAALCGAGTLRGGS